MARVRQAIPQKDFRLGAVRKEAVERDDVELVNLSVQKADNCVILSTGALEARQGFQYVATVNSAVQDFFEITVGDGLNYDLLLIPSGGEVYDETGNLITSFTGATWSSVAGLWVNAIGDNILIGSQNDPVHLLQYDSGTWTFGLLGWASLAGGASGQPYWAFRDNVAIQPSARSGSVTVLADADVFTSAYVGLRIRYVNREITITGYTDARTVTGTVVQELPPTQRLTVANASEFLVGEAVEGDTSGAQGVVAGVSGNDVDVLVTKYFEGFSSSETLVSPTHKSAISGKSTISPAATTIWDEPLMSAVRGYPGDSADHNGRVIFVDFAQAPDALAASAAGTINDFSTGVEDDDAIIERIGASEGGRLYHARSAEDLILLTSKGPYYVQTGGGQAMTPTNFNPIRIDNVGANRIRPVVVNDGVVFITAGGSQIAACVLQGDIYKAWTVRFLTDFHSQNISTPSKLGSTTGASNLPERYVFAVNDDGSVAVGRWDRQIAQESIGWLKWTTQGSFVAMTAIFGKIHALVSRTINGSSKLFLERAASGIYLDAASGYTAEATFLVTDTGDNLVTDDGDTIIAAAGDATHLAGETAWVWADNYIFGQYPIDSFGFPTGAPDVGTNRQIGLNFVSDIQPWSRRAVQGFMNQYSAGKIIKMTVSVQDTVTFDVGGVEVSAYDFGDDTSQPPQTKTAPYTFARQGREPYGVDSIQKTKPGPFRVTALEFMVEG